MEWIKHEFHLQVLQNLGDSLEFVPIFDLLDLHGELILNVIQQFIGGLGANEQGLVLESLGGPLGLLNSSLRSSIDIVECGESVLILTLGIVGSPGIERQCVGKELVDFSDDLHDDVRIDL